ncbi:MAG: GAF domain-containing protein [Deltaproteobacteria bacterium]|jgi:signal transduction histidine kinase|nr:GAF domain-containing protein [Deltaproteobacteria bacterium]
MPFAATGDVAAFLAKLIRLANSNIQFESKVSNFLSIIAWQLGLDKTLLLYHDRKKKELSLHRQPDDYGAPENPFELSDTFFDRAINNRQSLLADAPDLVKLPEDWRLFFEPYIACLAVVPILDDKTCYGVLILLNKKTIDLSSGPYGQAVEAVSNQLAMAIKTNQLATDTRKRISVLNVLSDLGRTLASTIEVEKVMGIVPRIATGVFIADGCSLNVLDLTGDTLLYSSQYGAVPPAYNFLRYQGQQLPVAIADDIKRDGAFMGYLQDDPKKFELTIKEQGNTIISMPLMFQGQHQGSISLFNKLGGHRGGGGGGLSVNPHLFDREDLELLQAMNSIISGVVENALTFKKVESLATSNESMVRYLSNLYDISSAMMTTVRYDELVWIIVQALTLRQGLGFDKVLILLMNDSGPEPVLTSSAYWSANTTQTGPALLTDLLRKPSREEAQAMMEAGTALGIKIPVTPQSTRILARVTLEKKPLLGFRGLDTHDDLDLGDFGLRAYAAVPMLAKGREVGVIAVDRSLSGQPLTVDSLRDLTMLANQAGLAIENTQLYDDLRQANFNLSQVRSRLIEAEKMAAQGEMGTQLAHEIRNPLVSIGGFTQRLIKKMSPEDPLRRYPQVILEEVQRLNGVLNNVLDFSRDERGLIKAFQLEDVAKEVLASLKHETSRSDVTIITDFEEDLPKVSADDRQVMHVFLNLIYNATQAMGPLGGGKIYLKVFLVKDGENQFVACRVTDTGPGIADEILSSVFNPFFTTKTQGTGLGLSIVKKIVERYNGHLTVTNHPVEYPGSGACFTFMLPAATDA